MGSIRRSVVGIVTAVGLALSVLVAGGCSLPFDDDESPPAGESLNPVVDVRQLLRARARAIKRDQPVAFRRTLDPRNPALRRAQQRYFANLQQLPLGRFGYRVLTDSVRESSDQIVAEVELRMQLREFDRVPVASLWRFHFRRTDSGRVVLTQAIDQEFLAERDIELSPWDLTAIEVRRTAGALGIFDAESVDRSGDIMSAVQEGIDEVSEVIPYSWDQQVVVYALSDATVLSELDNLPGGDPDRLDGVAFPVRASTSSNKLASVRFVLHPRMLTREPSGRDRLIRHELTHVALEDRDDRVPIWLAEGMAEWVSVQPIPIYERLISRDALTRSQTGLQQLPKDGTFNGVKSSGNYGISWWACSYIVDEYGEDTLWRLFERMGAGPGTTSKNQDRVLEKVLGIDERQLANATGERIVDTFG